VLQSQVIIAPAASSPDLARARAKIEALPRDHDRAFDTLSGGVIRLFAQVNELEQAYRAERSEVARLRADLDRVLERLASGYDGRRITAAGKPDGRGSTPASRVAHRQGRAED
jgi:hypothetical protein